ncbi:MAG: TIGR00645 family protein [Proteobacteria bacterium]|jgi:uncharacterized protein (TIGR00645 family)|nr:TIGR00645 family protein [Pseudomonadota bacterium]
MEKLIERMLFASRWLLAPIYLGLSLSLVVLVIKFFAELSHSLLNVFSASEAEVVLSLLGLVDLSLVAGLVVMVMLSGYENFVSKMDLSAEDEKLGWLGKLDAGTLKLKVAASIVAISSIHLLRAFMDAESIGNDKLFWYVVIHLTFVVSAVLLGVLDRMTMRKHD